MDTFISLAKKGVEAYGDSQSDLHKTGGHEYNSPDNNKQGNDRPEFDRNEVVQNAQKHGSGESSLFDTALGFLSSNKNEHEKPLDEEGAQRAHQAAYGGNASGLSASALGSAAALQILKQFTSGQSSGGHSSGGNSQTQLISMAMAEATKLFDKTGGTSSGNKQDAVNGAAMTVMKLLVQSKFSGTIGGSNSGGLSELLGLASQFAK